MKTSRDFREKSDIFNKFIHTIENLNLSFPYEDWDDGRYSLEEFEERHRSVTKEMAASFALTFVFSLISMGPVWYHHNDCVTSGQYVLFQHPIILSLDYDGPI